MSVITRLATFICITAFSGSVAIMGARELRDALKSPTPAEMERAKGLIQQLRGDELFRIEAKYNQAHEKPPRKPGSVLPEYDLAKIKKFLSNLIGGPGTEVAEESVGSSAVSEQEVKAEE
ncbi:MAG: hypothetical protein ACK5GN_09595 [Pseudomonadota bacterium]|jgi:hypothetical protein